MKGSGKAPVIAFLFVVICSSAMNSSVVFGQCFSAATAIHDIQGPGDTSGMLTQYHTIEGVVTAVYQDAALNINGFYLQEEESDWDTDPLTSEGIFVYNTSYSVAVGDIVRLRGSVAEYNGLTELKYVSSVEICGAGTVSPVEVSLPFPDDDYLERFEGMLIELSQELTVTDTYNLSRYGQFTVSDGPLWIPTNVVEPGPAAVALQAENTLNNLIIDDSSKVDNPDPIPYPAPGLSAGNTLRSGYRLSGIRGIVTDDSAGYRLFPTTAPSFIPANPRSNSPQSVGGDLKIASFNVLNYFNGPTFPTSRGASSLSEFNRQRAKIISAILAIDADVIGLLEIENDGYGTDSAIQDLVNGLNDDAPFGKTFGFIDPGVAALGTDEITLGIIYRIETVLPVGDAETIDSPTFDYGNRKPLAQTFEAVSSGELFTFVINHFRAKGCSSATGVNADQGDGQGCWNQARVEAAQEVIAWLNTDPTTSGDPDFIIVGDLNSYAKEDPITTIKNGGFVDLIDDHVANPYSYVFMGQAGYLDHALASTSLATQVTGATEWHINADEPRVLDYNEEYKTPGQINSLYNDDPFRSSDHDPVVVGLELGGSNPGNLPLDIPDNDATGVQATYTCNQNTIINSMSVFIDISHTYIGDLKVTLSGPASGTVTLHNRSGGSSNDIIGWYPLELTPAESLTLFNGTNAKGTWTLTISDHAAYDIGKLNDWQISFD